MAVLLSYALTTLLDVKELLGIDAGNTSKDNLIIRKINQATEMIEGYCQRRFKETTYTDEEYKGSHTDQLLLRNYPLTSDVVLKARDTSLNQTDFNTVDAEQYFTDDNAGIVNAISSFYGGYNRWQVTYSAGYVTIPADLAEAAATLAAFLVDNGTSGTNVKRKREGAREIEYQTNNSNSGDSLFDSLGIDETLNRYANTVISGQR